MSVRRTFALIVFGLAAVLARAQSADPVTPLQPLTNQERWKIYWNETYLSPVDYVRAAGAASGGFFGKDPDAWPRNSRGYGLHVLDTFGRFTLQDTYREAGAAALGHEIRFQRSGLKGFGPRFGHAFAAAFVTTDRNGKKVFDVSQVGAAYGSEFTALLWRPDGSRSATDGLRNGSIQVGLNVGLNVIREFGPELKHFFTRR